MFYSPLSMRLSEVDRGRYLDNPEATKAAFDENGYYKTGDLARWENNEYILMGRTSECEYRCLPCCRG